MAEGIEKQAEGKDTDDRHSIKYIQKYFKFISDEDKNNLTSGLRRTIRGRPFHKLQTRSIINILWNARCNAAHGREYWMFLLPENKQTGISTMLINGHLGGANKKRRMFLETNLTFNDLKNVFIKTGISRIKKLF